MNLSFPKAMRWWEKGLHPNMREVESAQDLADSLLIAGDKLVVVDFFSPGSDGFRQHNTPSYEKAVSGNLCRCTGYRPIVDACKSFAADVDLEDLGLNCFWKKGDD
jgi:hypothetical protein